MARKYWKANIEISNICNLRCSFCPEVVRPKKLMEPEFFRRILEQVAPLTNTVALHLMGDPLVHPKLSEFVALCDEHGVKIFLVTNGLLLRENHMETLLHPAFRQVNFSLHSFADNFKDRSPDKYLDRVFEFTEMAFARRPTLFINYRLWNLSDPRGQSTDNRQILDRIAHRFQVKIPEMDIRVKKNWVVRDRLSLHFDTEFIWPNPANDFVGTEGTCQGLSSHFGVLVDGTVVPCCLDKEAAIPLGNIAETPLIDILKSERATAMLRGFQTGNLVEDLCQRCNYIERFERREKVSALST